ncbi:MAG: asparaginase [Microscillaceae bacterium]|nr:asparaginase [Microscillaceae bacterium]MDW8460072.1 asparaginase [Cytophagales bacterium]
MRKITINTSANTTASILIIYTGGTIGMVYDEKYQNLVPFDVEIILKQVPELRLLEYAITVISFEPEQLIDSSNIKPHHWFEVARIIQENYALFDGFVILHGTDTMAYTASVLSFLFKNLQKPVILTGAQLPIGAIRNDARRNLITSIQIAAAKRNGLPIVPEVCIFFNDFLLRGNRSRKVENIHFDAFHSANYPHLAQVGINITYNEAAIMPIQLPLQNELEVQFALDENIAILKLFPAIRAEMIKHFLEIPNLKAVVLETYGAGNAPTDKWFIDLLRQGIEKGIVIFNVSQCIGGVVIQGKYATSRLLKEIGVLSGADLTTEAAVSKLMYLLAQNLPKETFEYQLTHSLRGEMRT